MTEVKDFGYLGNDFQLKLIAQLIIDKKFSQNILEIISPNYFDNPNYKQLVSLIKDYYQKYDNAIPSFTGLKEQILTEVKDDFKRSYLVTVLDTVQEKINDDIDSVQDKAMKFCKQQELKKAVTKIQKIIEVGDFENYEKCIEIIDKATSFGNEKDEGTDVYDDMDSVLADDYRHPIPTGITGIDNEIGGGLGKGELAVFLAPLGVGKSTFLTKVANNAYNLGHNVLQIFFEGPESEVKRKHYACWSGIDLSELNQQRDTVKTRSKKFQEGNTGKLIIKKFLSDSTTVNHIKQYMRKLMGQGIRIDMLIIDYVDCLQATKITDDQTANEGVVIRQIEALTSEFNVATWAATQTNRSGAAAEVVDVTQIQGSIKKAQVAHLIISAAKSAEQKQNKLATMAIIKSRFGKDGKIWQNMKFDNGKIQFSVDEGTVASQFTFEKEQEARKDTQSAERVKQVFENLQKAKLNINTPATI